MVKFILTTKSILKFTFVLSSYYQKFRIRNQESPPLVTRVGYHMFIVICTSFTLFGNPFFSLLFRLRFLTRSDLSRRVSRTGSL